MEAASEAASEDVWVAAEDSDTEGEKLEGEREGERDGPEEAVENGSIQLVNMVSHSDSQEPGGLTKSSVRFLDLWKGLQDSLPISDDYSSLHKEILEFCSVTRFSRAEEDQRKVSINKIRALVKQVWPKADIVLFGSTASGLALPGSDIDLTIIPDSAEKDGAGPGSMKQQPTTNEWLSALAYTMKRSKLFGYMHKIGKAKVPILKCVFHNGLACDISYNVANGPTVIPLIKELLGRFPALRPLCLVLKVFLGQRNLNEVFKGGIGSYCLLVMICAHLSEIYAWADEQKAAEKQAADEQKAAEKQAAEEQKAADKQAAADAAATVGEKDDGSGGTESGKAGEDGGEETVDKEAGLLGKAPVKPKYRMEEDLGLLLLTFFARYGELHDYAEDVVSICPNPVKSRSGLDSAPSEGNEMLLAVEDPQVPRRDIGRNSYRVDVAKVEFARAAALLRMNWDKPGILPRILDLSRDRNRLSMYLAVPEIAPSITGDKRKAAEQDGYAGRMSKKARKNRLHEAAKMQRGDFGPHRGFAPDGPDGGMGGLLGRGEFRGPQQGPGGPGGILGMAPRGPQPGFGSRPPFPLHADINPDFHFHDADEPFLPLHGRGMAPMPFHEGLRSPPNRNGPGGRGGRGPRPSFDQGPGPRGRLEGVPPFPGSFMGGPPLGPGPEMGFFPEGGPREFEGFPDRPRAPRMETAQFGPEGQWIGNVPWQPSGLQPGMDVPFQPQMGAPPFINSGMPPVSGNPNWPRVQVTGPGAGGPPLLGMSGNPPLVDRSSRTDASSAAAMLAPATAEKGEDENTMFILVRANEPTVELERVKGQRGAFERQVLLASQMGVAVSRLTKRQFKSAKKQAKREAQALAVVVAPPPGHFSSFGRPPPLPEQPPPLSVRGLLDNKGAPVPADRAGKGGILGHGPGNNNPQQALLHPPLPERVEPRQDGMLLTPPGMQFPPGNLQPGNLQLLKGGDSMLGSGPRAAGMPVYNNIHTGGGSGSGLPPLLSQFGRELEIRSQEPGPGQGGLYMQSGLKPQEPSQGPGGLYMQPGFKAQETGGQGQGGLYMQSGLNAQEPGQGQGGLYTQSGFLAQEGGQVPGGSYTQSGFHAQEGVQGQGVNPYMPSGFNAQEPGQGQGGLYMQSGLNPQEPGQGQGSLYMQSGFNAQETSQGQGASYMPSGFTSQEAGQGQGGLYMQPGFNGSSLMRSVSGSLGGAPVSGFDTWQSNPATSRDGRPALQNYGVPMGDVGNASFNDLGYGQPTSTIGTGQVAGRGVDGGFNLSSGNFAPSTGYGYETSMGEASIPGGVPPWHASRSSSGYSQDGSAGMGNGRSYR